MINFVNNPAVNPFDDAYWFIKNYLAPIQSIGFIIIMILFAIVSIKFILSLGGCKHHNTAPGFFDIEGALYAECLECGNLVKIEDPNEED